MVPSCTPLAHGSSVILDTPSGQSLFYLGGIIPVICARRRSRLDRRRGGAFIFAITTCVPPATAAPSAPRRLHLSRFRVRAALPRRRRPPRIPPTLRMSGRSWKAPLTIHAGSPRSRRRTSRGGTAVLWHAHSRAVQSRSLLGSCFPVEGGCLFFFPSPYNPRLALVPGRTARRGYATRSAV